MIAWAVAALLGTLLALAAYRGREVRAARAAPLVLLRALAIALALALLLGAPAGRGRAPPPLVALDASASWRRGGDSAAWRAARDLAARADTLWLFGDSLRPGVAPALPTDAATFAAPAIARALASGRAIVLITDGEVDDAAALGALPPGSSVVLRARTPARDVAVADLAAPASAVAGDTIEVRITLRAAELPVPHATVTLRAGAALVASRAVDSLAPRAERVLAFRIVAPAAGIALVTAIVTAPGDVEARNDSATVALEVARAAGAVFASSAPDEDMRYLVPVLRGALSLPARGFYRVAPGAWRREGTLGPVSEQEVRAALRSAPLAILHGDTALFGAPRTATSGALLLLPAANVASGEWFATGAPASPVAGALAGAEWDSLPPVAAADRAPSGDWTALTVARARRYDARAAIIGSDRGRRVVIAGASGFWRWRFRGGASAGAYDALWGGILDWLTAERHDPRAAAPESGLLRAGEPVRWRRGSAKADSLVTLTLGRRGAAGDDTLLLRFAGGATRTESRPLASGVYDVRTSGGASVLVVNASREWLPRSPTLVGGIVKSGGSLAVGDALPLRDRGWAYLLAMAALCAEWMLRRRAGLR